ncbi:DUF4184 family protein [Nocardia lasii]|uniref:DUF4184 family protein n=1 Tax=Nocardia lasii TaxID=1616107 RepID=A0ABW1JYZ0_9NOCA
MPITFAHPAAVLPFARHLPLPALVAGSVAPDIAYYLPIHVPHTHSLPAILWWDLPIGLALLLTFRLSRGPALLPPADSHPTAIRTLAALALGATTHVLWDSFTQTTGFAVQHWDFLRTTVIEPHKTYNVLGYVCSLTGTALITYLLLRPASAVTTRAHLPLIAALLTAAVLGAILAADDPVTRTSTYDLIRHTIIGAAKAIALTWIAWMALWHLHFSGSCALSHVPGESPPRNRRGP